MPVEIRRASSGATSRKGMAWRWPAKRIPPGWGATALVSTMVFQLPQAGHFPSHLELS